MKIYQVGGAVRDKLLGVSPKDIDFVVVDSDVQTMLKLGYIQENKSFPVFIDSERNEYVLARRENKRGMGHGNFSFETEGVFLKDDLMRRDLTINSMALSSEGELIDPFSGLEDLKNKVLRHTSHQFPEDPLRVFRVARFAAKFEDFSIHPDTLQLMKTMTQAEDYKHLSGERILKEMEGALKERRPSRFFEVLKEVGGLDFYFPELGALIDVPQKPEYHPEGDCWIHTMLVLDQAASITDNIKVRFAALVHDLGKGITPQEVLPAHHGHEESGLALVKDLCDRLRVPNEWRETANVVTGLHLKVHRIKTMKASSIVRMFYELDAYRRPYIIKELQQGCEADEMGKYKKDADAKGPLEEYFAVTQTIGFKDCGPGLKGESIANEIRQLRVNKLKEYIQSKG